MIHEIHIEDIEEIEVFRPKHPNSNTTRITLADLHNSFVIVIPDGDILDGLAHWLMMASLESTDPDIGEASSDGEF